MFSSPNFTSSYTAPALTPCKILLSVDQAIVAATTTIVAFNAVQNGQPDFISSVSGGEITFAQDGIYFFSAAYTVSTAAATSTDITYSTQYNQPNISGSFATPAANPIQATVAAIGTFALPTTLPFSIGARAGDKIILYISSSAIGLTILASSSYLTITKAI